MKRFRSLAILLIFTLVLQTAQIPGVTPLAAYAAEDAQEEGEQDAPAGEETVPEDGSGEGETSVPPEETDSVPGEGDTSVPPETTETQPSDDGEAGPAAGEEEQVTDTPAEGDVPQETEAADLPEGVNGMPEGYSLTEKEQAFKRDARKHDIASTVSGLNENTDYVKNEVICLADSEEHAQMIADAYGAELKDYAWGVATMVLNPKTLSVKDAVTYSQDTGNNLPLVEPNYIKKLIEPVRGGAGSAPRKPGISFKSRVPVEKTPLNTTYNDPFLNPQNPMYQWYHNMIHSYAAWGVARDELGSSGIRVAVLDTGINLNHEELTGHANAEVVSDEAGYGTDDKNAHGTHVSGIISASRQNDKGGAGIAPGIQVVSYKVLHDEGYGETAIILRALNMVAGTMTDGVNNNDTQIVNMSLGGPGYSVYEAAVFQLLYDSNVTVVAAAGNEFQNTPMYPASYDHVISVAAVNEDGARANFSNYGSLVDIAAPGTNIYSSVPGEGDDDYDAMSGTSQATPVVAGACALYMSVYGATKPDYMEAVLKNSTNQAESPEVGAGILDLAKLMSQDVIITEVRDEDTNEFLYEYLGELHENAPPQIYIADITRPITEYPWEYVYGGQTHTSKRIYHPSSVIEIGYDEDWTEIEKLAAADDKIIYTTDGTTPSVVNGEPVGRTFVTGDGTAGLYEMTAKDLVDMTSGKDQKVTIKAARVNAVGRMSDVTTLTFKVRPTLYVEGTVIEKVNVPSMVLAGKSVTLSAKAAPSQKVTWSIAEYTGDLNKKNTKVSAAGKLTTKKNTAGTVTLRCKAANGKTQDFTVTVSDASVQSLSLDKTSITLTRKESKPNPIEDIVATVTHSGSLSYADMINPENGILRWTSSNEKVAKVTATSDGATITAIGSGKAVITCQATDGSGKNAKVSVTVGTEVMGIDVLGQGIVPIGKSATFKAVVTPADAGNKAVTWSIAAADSSDENAAKALSTTVKNDRVSVDAKGKVTVGKNVPSGLSFVVSATAKDESAIAGSKTFMTQLPATKLTVTTDDSYKANEKVYQITEKNGSVTALRLYTYNIDGGTGAEDETAVQLNATPFSGETAVTGVIWTSSNPQVVTVDGTGLARAGKAGTATLTCAAADGSGKKASVKVTVIVPASSLAITVPEDRDNWYLACGKSLQLKAVPGDLYGKPSVSKVTWEYEILSRNDGGEYTYANSEAMKKAKVFTVSSTGKITAGSVKTVQAWKDRLGTDKWSNIMLEVTATTTDGTDRSATFTIFPLKPTTWVKLYDYYGERYTNNVKISQSYETDGYPIFVDSDGLADFAIKSSNDDIVTASWDYKQGVVWLLPHERGTTTLTLTPTDGSGKKVKLKVTVTK